MIIDTDIGNSTDDLFALDLAFNYTDKGLGDILGIVVSREGEGFYVLADSITENHPVYQTYKNKNSETGQKM